MILRVTSLLLSWGLVSLLGYTWLTAALSPSHRVIIPVNSHGELWIEWVLVPIAWLTVTIGTFLYLRREYADGRRGSDKGG